MKDFAGKIAAVTGGGSGTGRELVSQLVPEACNKPPLLKLPSGPSSTVAKG
jgi:hypothetical protein